MSAVARGEFMSRIDGFVQRHPRDGEPASQRTEVYAGYDDHNLYFIFVVHDSEPEAIRARMSRRESFGGDDSVAVLLDTFHDKRRAYAFRTNPHGVQLDAMWTEGQGYDTSFDTVWDSEGMLTERRLHRSLRHSFQKPALRTHTRATLGRDLHPRGCREESRRNPPGRVSLRMSRDC